MKTRFSVMLLATLLPLAAREPKRPPRPTLEEVIAEAEAKSLAAAVQSPGSLYSPSGALGNLSRDPRAAVINDLITVIVSDRATALSKGSVASARNSSAKYSVSALAGPTKAGGRLSDLAGLSGDQQLKGDGATTRENSIQTTLSARVTHVLPNGVMVVEGGKSVAVNSEVNEVMVRGLIRREDIGPGNTIRSDRISNLEIAVNGKGVVGDAVKRPFILYRILLGLLPF